jgi:predicted DNA-binding transcriptional regulator AlpA
MKTRATNDVDTNHVELPPHKQHTDPLYSRPEAAAYLDLVPQTLAVWKCNGKYSIPVVKIGRLVRYRKSDLDAFLARRTVAG